ncbi:MAG: hypothetical protein ABSH52_07905 [Terriglobia bacterium]|jgi:hypothetical protein
MTIKRKGPAKVHEEITEVGEATFRLHIEPTKGEVASIADSRFQISEARNREGRLGISGSGPRIIDYRGFKISE